MSVVDELVALLGFKIEGEENLKSFNKKMDQATKKAEAFGKKIGTAFAVVGGAVAFGVGYLGKTALGVSAQFETYLATLETIEGSGDKAKKAFDWITDFAKTTPFEVDELTRAFVKLRSYGLDPMDGSMSVMGDTASAMGKSLDQVVEAVADAATMQFERLKELGIKASQAGDQVTFSWTENGKAMEKSVKKTGEEVTKFLYDIWGRKFNGAMIRQSKTWNGMMSNMSDTWTMFQYKIGQGGFFEAVKSKLGDVMDLLDKWEEEGKIDAIAKALSGGFTAAADAIGYVVQQIAGHIEFLAKNWDTLSGYIKGFGATLAYMVARAFPVVTVFALIALAIDDLLTYLEGGESVIGDFIKWLQSIIPISDSVAQAIAGLAGAIGLGLTAAFLLAPMKMTGLAFTLVRALVVPLGALLLSGLTGLAGMVTAGVTAMFAGVPAAFAAVRTAMLAAVALWGAPLAAALTGLSGAIMSGLTAAFALLSNPIGWAVILAGVVAALVAYFWDDLVSAWNAIDFPALGKAIVDGIMNGLRAAGSAITSWFNSILPDWVTGGVNVPVTFESTGLPPPTGAQVRAASNYSDSPLAATLQNAKNNLDKTQTAGSGAVIANDNSSRSQTNNVNAPVTVNVQQATQAPAAAAKAVGSAVNTAAQPSRMQSGGFQ